MKFLGLRRREKQTRAFGRYTVRTFSLCPHTACYSDSGITKVLHDINDSELDTRISQACGTTRGFLLNKLVIQNTRPLRASTKRKQWRIYQHAKHYAGLHESLQRDADFSARSSATKVRTNVNRSMYDVMTSYMDAAIAVTYKFTPFFSGTAVQSTTRQQPQKAVPWSARVCIYTIRFRFQRVPLPTFDLVPSIQCGLRRPLTPGGMMEHR